MNQHIFNAISEPVENSVQQQISQSDLEKVANSGNKHIVSTCFNLDKNFAAPPEAKTFYELMLPRAHNDCGANLQKGMTIDTMKTITQKGKVHVYSQPFEVVNIETHFEYIDDVGIIREMVFVRPKIDESSVFTPKPALAT